MGKGYFGRLRVGGDFLWYVEVCGGLFWLDGTWWTFFMDLQGWMEVYSGWFGVGGHFLWVDGCEWMFILDGGGEWSLVLVKLIYNYFLCGTLNL